jgi:hypothetical protein
VTQLEVTPQNVKQPKNGRNSGHVRNSGDYGTIGPKWTLIKFLSTSHEQTDSHAKSEKKGKKL